MLKSEFWESGDLKIIKHQTVIYLLATARKKRQKLNWDVKKLLKKVIFMRPVCVTQAVQKQHGLIVLSQDAFAVHTHNIYPLFWFQIQALLAYTESTFSALWCFITVQLHNHV